MVQAVLDVSDLFSDATDNDNTFCITAYYIRNQYFIQACSSVLR